ncbi:MAG: hypothetical protein JW864_17605 [Spirochaetes bacterium]|nr:hypothetical protein [Spirochaetota bacterium]
MRNFKLNAVIALFLAAGLCFAGCSSDDSSSDDAPELSSAKAITLFSFTAAANSDLEADVTGTVNGSAVTASVPNGTDVKALVSSFTTTGVLVSVGSTAQVSGTTANDFSDDVEYTVTAEDGSTAVYIVSVSIREYEFGGTISQTFNYENVPGLETSDKLGNKIAVSGNYALVSVSKAYDDVNNFADGAVYAFERNSSGTWEQTQVIRTTWKLETGDENISKWVNQFGRSIAIDGDCAVIGADYGVTIYNDDDPPLMISNDYLGTAFIFERNESGTWEQKQMLLASDGEHEDLFGERNVAITGNYVFVGARGEDGGDNTISNAGAVYVFKQNADGTWNENETQILHVNADDMTAGDHFGMIMSVYGDYAAFGVTQRHKKLLSDPTIVFPDDMVNGAVYLFKLNGDVWEEEQVIRASDGYCMDNFGYSVSINGNYMFIGATTAEEGSDETSPGTGAVYVFKLENDAWSEAQTLYSSNGETDDTFGSAVSVNGDYAFIAAKGEDGGEGNPVEDASAVYVYKLTSGHWEEQDILHASEKREDGEFGQILTFSGLSVFIGDPYVNESAGAFYIYE